MECYYIILKFYRNIITMRFKSQIDTIDHCAVENFMLL